MEKGRKGRKPQRGGPKPRGTSGQSSGRGGARGNQSGRGASGRARSDSHGRRSGDRGESRNHSHGKQKARRDLRGAAVDLPPWVIEDLARVTPDDRVSAALAELGAATQAMIEGRYKVALRAARKAKELAPRDSTVRETLGLAAYRTGDWQTALTELRTYRRISGEATHLPVEMDALRALGRNDDVEKAWQEINRLKLPPVVYKEGLVVYGSHLIDVGDLAAARKLTSPKQISRDPYPADLRVWYVAARANALAGDGKTARQLRDAITLADPAFPGLDELDRIISRISE